MARLAEEPTRASTAIAKGRDATRSRHGLPTIGVAQVLCVLGLQISVLASAVFHVNGVYHFLSRQVEQHVD